MSKQCKKCKNIFEGIRCKICTAEYKRKYYIKNRDKLLQYSNQYKRENKEKVYQHHKNMIKKYPEKSIARRRTRYLVDKGILIKKPCEICGKLKVEAHHSNYSKPEDVKWVCNEHHRRIERRIVL